MKKVTYIEPLIHVFYALFCFFVFIFFRSQMPWRGLTLGLLCGEGYLGLRFSDEPKAFWVDL